jgi:hypothetical protein
MTRYEETKAAIMGILKDIQATPEKAISMYDIGIPLVTRGYAQGELVDTLFSMEREGIIELLMSNGLRLKKPLE